MHQQKYYIALPDAVYVYDYAKGLWHMEDCTGIVDIVATDETLWFLVQDPVTKAISYMRQSTEAEGIKNENSWSATFGAYGFDQKNKKYLTRFDLRMKLSQGAVCNVYLQYDEDPRWHKVGCITGRTINSFLIPVIPRRCDHCRLKLEGRGDMRLISLSRILEQGSDA